MSSVINLFLFQISSMEETSQRNDTIYQLLDHYMNTGSERILEKLKKQGVIPLPHKKKPIIL